MKYPVITILSIIAALVSGLHTSAQETQKVTEIQIVPKSEISGKTDDNSAAAALNSINGKASTISAAFIRLPADCLDILPVSSRLDLLDYASADSTGSVRNALEGKSTLLALNDDFLEVQLTPASSLQIRRLPTKNNGFVFMTIYTVGGNGHAMDSDVRFFNEMLSPLDAGKIFQLPRLTDFFPTLRKDKNAKKTLEQIIPFPTFCITASECQTDNTISVALTVRDFINMDDREFIDSHIVPALTYIWDGSKYRLEGQSSGHQ